MTHNILDVLTYMFDYLFEEAEHDSSNEIDDTTLKAHLSDAGFEPIRIEKALSWLENIATLQDGNIKPFANTHGGMRIYSEVEKLKLDAKSQYYKVLIFISKGYPSVKGRFYTRYAPVRRSSAEQAPCYPSTCMC